MPYVAAEDAAAGGHNQAAGMGPHAAGATMPAAGASAPPPAPKPLMPLFMPPARGFSAGLSLQLSAADPLDTVHYTLDGSLPTASSPVYGAPLAIEKTTLVRARVTRGTQLGAVVNQAYVALAADAKVFDSNLPVLVIHRQGGDAPDAYSREYVPALLLQFEPGKARTKLDGPATYSSRLGIKVRGRSTRNQPKPSYTLELWGDTDDDAPYGLLGMPADGDWVLYAPYTFDRALLRNAFIYELSNRIGRYAPRTRFCEVFVVTGSDALTRASYVGVYSLTERISRGPQRVPIQKLSTSQITEPTITGGYIVQIDAPDELDEAFQAAGTTFVYVQPKADDIVPEQTEYIESYLDSWQRAISATDGKDAMTGKPYTELMDSAAFIDHHILNMLAKNPDAFELSSYMYKDRGGALFAGPIWDFDISMGGHDAWGDRTLDPTHWGPGSSDSNFGRAHYGELFEHSEFTAAYWARWKALLAGHFNSAEFHTLIESMKASLAEAEARNRARWPEAGPRNGSYDDEVEFLEQWLDQRLTWLKANVGTLP